LELVKKVVGFFLFGEGMKREEKKKKKKKKKKKRKEKKNL